MYVMLVNVHDISCVTPGRMSNRIFRPRMMTGWIVQAPVVCQPSSCQVCRFHQPLALTHCELRFGLTAWSLICSTDSGGS